MEKYFFDFFIWRHSRPKTERLGNTDPTTGLTSVGPDVVIFRSGALLHHERVPPVCGEEGEASQLFPQLHEGAPAQGGRQHRGKDIFKLRYCLCLFRGTSVVDSSILYSDSQIRAQIYIGIRAFSYSSIKFFI